MFLILTSEFFKVLKEIFNTRMVTKNESLHFKGRRGMT
ncbi:hypothetical protein CSCA_0320 [Clostridium scatologenes]|uniref:Uncharacterized protein n=1 Tax=Clostridium scatologenes TaxID=1548 RepID=A0A0E3JYF2_CLOSL|nr:hypothetical protein CSCA_0320 [Clostridium scatologenes]